MKKYSLKYFIFVILRFRVIEFAIAYKSIGLARMWVTMITAVWMRMTMLIRMRMAMRGVRMAAPTAAMGMTVMISTVLKHKYTYKINYEAQHWYNE